MLHGIVEEGRGLLGDDDLAALRAHRRLEADHGRQAGIAEPGGEHDAPGAEHRRCRCGDMEAAGAELDALDAMLRQIVGAALLQAVCSARKSRSALHVAVERANSCAPTTSGPISGSISCTARASRTS